MGHPPLIKGGLHQATSLESHSEDSKGSLQPLEKTGLRTAKLANNNSASLCLSKLFVFTKLSCVVKSLTSVISGMSFCKIVFFAIILKYYLVRDQ